MPTTKTEQKTRITKPGLPASNSSGWESEFIYSSARQYFDDLLLDIDNAVSSIVFAVYIFSLDDLGQRVAAALARAARRKVKVRLMVDGFGSAADAETIAEQLTGVGAEVRIYHPLPWYWGNYRWSLRLGDGPVKFYHFIASMNRRDHRKFCVLDGEISWCGSFNISQDHLKQEIPWRDYAVRLTGDASHALTGSFDSIWFRRKKPKISLRAFNLFRSNASIRLRRLSNRLLVEQILNARKRVWICSAYFAPSGAVIKAIKSASARNVDVRIIVAGRSDVRLFPFLSATYFADLLKMGITIYSFQAGMLHAKAMLVDQQCLIGSTNLNHRSFLHDLELDVMLSTPASIERIKSLLQQDMKNSMVLSLENVSKWGRYILFGWLLRIMRYWM